MILDLVWRMFLTFNSKNIPLTNIFKQIDYKTFKYSVIAMFVLVIPFNALHELGHLIPCWLDGNEGTMAIGLFSSQATCTGLDDSTVFAFFGGGFAAIVSFVVLSIPKVNQFTFLVIALVSFGIAHFVNAIVEAYFRNWYMTSDLAIPVISLVSFVIFAITLLAFGRKTMEGNTI